MGQHLATSELNNIRCRCQQLIMIGDHRQLPPKAEHYRLRKEAGLGFDIDVSLFERLARSYDLPASLADDVIGGPADAQACAIEGSPGVRTGWLRLPMVTLAVQHRMRPEFSRLIRATVYPDLLDHSSTLGRPRTPGVERNLVFVDHREMEAGDENAAALGSSSKMNLHEVAMVVGIAVHLLRQRGVTTDRVAIITPYLGQLAQIRKALAVRDVASSINDLDRGDLARLDLDDLGGSGGGGAKAIRAATIDNYQGEEADFVIISLVRSNVEGDIGFLSSPERVNVLLSRARHGMFLVGNLETLARCRSSKGRALWQQIRQLLEHDGAVLDHFPVLCERHRLRIAVRAPKDFETLTPHGGCTLPCEMSLDCGHECDLACHPEETLVHARARCKEQVEDSCGYGHPGRRACGDEGVRCCVEVTWMCPRGHIISGRCWGGRKASCKRCEAVEQIERSIQLAASERRAEAEEAAQELEELNVRLKAAAEGRDQDERLALIRRERTLVQARLDQLVGAGGVGAEDSEVPHDIGSKRPQGSTRPGSSAAKVQRLKRWAKDQVESNSTKESLGTGTGHVGGLASPLINESVEVKCPPSSKEHAEILASMEGYNDSSHGRLSRTQILEEKNAVDGKRQQSGEVGAFEAIADRASETDSKSVEGDFFDEDPECQSTDMDLLPVDTCSKIAEMKQELPPRPETQTKQGVARSVEQDICSVLEVYDPAQPLQADDVLDTIIKSWVEEGADPLPEQLTALQYILSSEIDPHGIREMHQHLASNVRVASLSEAVMCWARIVSIRREFPMQAQELAKKLISFATTGCHDFPFPECWIGQAKQLLGNTKAPKLEIQEGDSELDSRDSVEARWGRILQEDPVAPSVMAEILSMVGIEDVKKSFINQYHRIKLSRQQNDSEASSYNVRFEGNPGTGKTTIARLYGKFLKQLKILPDTSIFVESSGATLVLNGVQSLQDDLEKAKEGGGGVFFIDEAYQLISDHTGRKVLDFLLPKAESLKTSYGRIVWILAGYQTDMEKMFEHNPGLPSRFPLRLKFKDYSDDELRLIFNSHLIYQTGQPESKLKMDASPPPSVCMQAPPARNSMRGLGGFGGAQVLVGTCRLDRFGNNWVWNGNLWQDKFENMTGYGPENIGSASNPLISKDGEKWTCNQIEGTFTWTGENGDSQSGYPGSPNLKNVEAKRLRETPFRCEDEKSVRIAMRRIGRQRGRTGFGNARAVLIFFDKVRERQAVRVEKAKEKGLSPNIFLFKKEDLLGEHPTKALLKQSKAYLELQAMEGLAPVKESVDCLFDLIISNLHREAEEKPLLDVVINRVFLGNPGTGKTSVAKIYGRLLAEMGLLSKGEVICKTPSDFVGDVIGSSEKQTRDILKAAEGCVLVIDEAYSLYSGGEISKNNDPYKTAVIDTIVEQVQGRPGEDRAVVLLGYKEQMVIFFKNVNPGLSRRFQLDMAFEFPDYNDSALVRILTSKTRADGLNVNLSVAKLAIATLARARAQPHFGNAGAVDNLLSAAKIRMQKRDGRSNILTAEDFGVGRVGPDDDVLETLFDDMIASGEIKLALERLRSTVQFALGRGENPKIAVNFNYLFVGNPGTGKTTVARKMGKMFKALGLLPDDTVYEVSASDLLTGYVGQAGLKTREILQRSRGGVLFIDEAYQLNPTRGGNYMTEAVDELVKGLTLPDLQGKLVVILAGYEGDMDEMLATNPGLKSRFPERLRFEDMTAQAAADLLIHRMTERRLPISDADKAGLVPLAARLAACEDFGNGRDVETWAKMVYQVVSSADSRSFFPKSSAGAVGLRRASGPRRTHVTLGEVTAALNQLLAQRVTVQAPASGQGKFATKSLVSNSVIGEAGRTNIQQSSAPSMVSTPARTAVLTTDMPMDNVTMDGETEVTQMEGAKVAAVGFADGTELGLFANVDKGTMGLLQVFLQETGLNSETGVESLSKLEKFDPKFQHVVGRMVSELNMTPDFALKSLFGWQEAQRKLRKERAKLLTKGMQAIWRCGVCGRDDKPWIACWVAPYIVRYEQIV